MPPFVVILAEPAHCFPMGLGVRVVMSFCDFSAEHAGLLFPVRTPKQVTDPIACLDLRWTVSSELLFILTLFLWMSFAPGGISSKLLGAYIRESIAMSGVLALTLLAVPDVRLHIRLACISSN
jgi:hypothetical protein